MPNPITARIEVFRPGTFTPMDGAPISYSAADLRAVADAYDPDTAPAPIVVGHPDLDAPAFGWVEGFDFEPDSGRLFARLHQIEPAFAEQVRAGRYRKVSMAFFRPDQDHNPVPGVWYPKHVGFLGAAAPAVPGLTNVSFAVPAGAVFTAAFGEPAFGEIASLLRNIREMLIEKFGAEDADRALPGMRLDWLAEMTVQGRDTVAQAFAVPAEPLPAPDANPAFAAQEASLAAREARLAEREREIAHGTHAAFAAGLVTQGRLLPALQDRVVALLDALPAAGAVTFAAGEQITPVEALRQILAALPAVVTFGPADVPVDGSGSAAAFAADGRPVDPARLEVHQKALAWQLAHPGCDYVTAVLAVS